MKKSDDNIWLSILADPHASETKWFEAALKLQARNSKIEPWWYRLSWNFPLLVTVLISVLGSYACCAYVDLGFDWGYRLVQVLCGQPGGQASNQGVFAILALAHVIFPLNMGLSFACAKRYFAGNHRWITALMMTLASADALWFGLIDPGFKPMCFLWLACNLTVGLLSFLVGSRVINRFYAHWDVRLGGFINVRRAFPFCAIYLVPSLIVAISSMLGISLDLRLAPETLLYSLPLFLIGFRIYRPSGSLASSIFGSALILAPVIVSGLANIFGTTFCLALDGIKIGPDLGWRAPLSGLLITSLTAGATTLGCLCAAICDHLDKKCRARCGNGSKAASLRPTTWAGPAGTDK